MRIRPADVDLPAPLSRFTVFLAVAVMGITSALIGCAVRGRTAPLPTNHWTRVVALPQGTGIRIWWQDATRGATGIVREDVTVIRADAAGLFVNSSAGPRQLSRADVRRVDVMHAGRDELTNGAMIGGAIGASYGAFVAARLANSDDPVGLKVVIAASAIGAGVGALVDSLRARPVGRTVYVQPRR